jgi:hypothetical protein
MNGVIAVMFISMLTKEYGRVSKVRATDEDKEVATDAVKLINMLNEKEEEKDV